MRTAIITKIKGLSIQTQQNTFVLFTLFKLTSDERKTLTKILTRKTSHNHSPNQRTLRTQRNKKTSKQPNKEKEEKAVCIVMKYPRASRALRWAPDPTLKRAHFTHMMLLCTVGNLGLSRSGPPPPDQILDPPLRLSSFVIISSYIRTLSVIFLHVNPVRTLSSVFQNKSVISLQLVYVVETFKCTTMYCQVN